MKVNIPPEILMKSHSQNILSLNISILKVKGKSTIILINNKQIQVPFVLDKNKNYQGVVKNNEFFIIEKKDFQKPVLKNANKSDKSLDNLLLNKNELHSTEYYNNPVMELLKNIIDDRSKNKENKDLYFSGKNKEEYFFVFNLNVFNNESKVFLKIDNNKNVFLNIFSEAELKSGESKTLTGNLRKKLNKKINLLNVAFIDKKSRFYDKIFSLLSLKNVDIKI